MEITIHSTSQITEVAPGVPARVWEGKTRHGTPVTCLLLAIGVEKNLDLKEFERELVEIPGPPTRPEVFG